MWTVIESPVGPLRLVEHHGSITAIEFSPFREGTGRPLGERNDADPVLAECARQLGAYFAGELTAFDLPLAPEGTEFQRRVWRELLEVKRGDTATYGEIAARLGMTAWSAARAVGVANGRNPIPIVIPCHRIIGANGTLTGYAGGLERKQQLLALESDSLF